MIRECVVVRAVVLACVDPFTTFAAEHHGCPKARALAANVAHRNRGVGDKVQ